MSSVNSIFQFISGQLKLMVSETGGNNTNNVYSVESGQLKMVLKIDGTSGTSTSPFIVEDGQLKINATFNEPANPSAKSAFIIDDGQLKMAITETDSGSATSPYLIENGQLKLSVSGISPIPTEGAFSNGFSNGFLI